MTAARQWRLAWVLRVVPGTSTIDERADGPCACLNHVPEEMRHLSRSGWNPGKEATRSEGMNPGGFTPSGGGLTMDTRGVPVAPASPSRFGTTATAMDCATATGEPVARDPRQRRLEVHASTRRSVNRVLYSAPSVA